MANSNKLRLAKETTRILKVRASIRTGTAPITQADSCAPCGTDIPTALCTVLCTQGCPGGGKGGGTVGCRHNIV